MTPAQKEIMDQFPDLDWFTINGIIYFIGLGIMPAGGQENFNEFIYLSEHGKISIFADGKLFSGKYTDPRNLLKEIKNYYKFKNFI